MGSKWNVAAGLASTVVLFLGLAEPAGAALKAFTQGDDLVFEGGTPGARIRVLDATEKRVGSGRLDHAGRLVLRGEGMVDPMLRLVEIDGLRASLADLFPPIELTLVAPPNLSAGLPLLPHLVVSRRTGGPEALIPIDVALVCEAGKRRFELGRLQSDATGVGRPVTAPLMVPANATGRCEIEARAAGAKLTSAVSLVRGVRVAVSTDRPLVQPGQRVHVRTLVLDLGTGKPVRGAKAVIELQSGQGTPLLRETVETTRFGLAETRFVVPASYTGDAVIAKATVEGTASERRLKAGRYVPPRVLLTVTGDADVVRQSDGVVKVTIGVRRLDAGPTAGSHGEVRVQRADGTQVGRAPLVADATGNAEVEVRVDPAKLSGQTSLQVIARAETPAGEIGEGRAQLAIDDGRLRVYAIPEGGRLQAGTHRRLWVVATEPSGAPVKATVTARVADAAVTASTDADGLALMTLPKLDAGSPVELTVAAGRRKGTRRVAVSMPSQGALGALLLDRAVLRPGESLDVTVHDTILSGSVQVALVVGQQPVASAVGLLRNGVTRLRLPVPAGVGGTVRVFAFGADAKGTLHTATRLAHVIDGRDLKIGLRADRESYRPRETVTLDVLLTDHDDRPTAGAVSVAIVDEGLRALGLEQPGIELALLRLGSDFRKRPTDLVLPPWAEHGLLMARDTVRLSVLAAAAESTYALGPKQESALPRASAAASAFRGAVDARAARIAKAVFAYYEKAGARAKAPTLTSLVASHRLTALDTRDPWGRSLELGVSPDPKCGVVTVSVWSRGVDGRERSKDDVHATTRSGSLPGLARCVHRSSAMAAFGFGGVGSGGGGAHHGRILGFAMAPVPLRTHFPETLLVTTVITDPQGRATLRFPVADSLTRWLVQARAVSEAGGLGAAEMAIEVTQPFSVDVSLPAELRLGDELVIPIGVTNRTKAAAEVHVVATVDGAGKGSLDRDVTVPAGGSLALPLRLVAARLGQLKATVTAKGQGQADGVVRSLTVVPTGVPVGVAATTRLVAGTPSTLDLRVSADAVPGTRQASVRLYASAAGAAVEGLEQLLRSPSGCFEQTSSTTYPNALVLDYLKRTNKDAPEVRGKAEGLLRAGWERLKSFEVKGGGFSWFGKAPANKVLTAFGVMEFEAMARSIPIDSAVRARTLAWLLTQRRADGAFEPDKEYLHAESWSGIQNNALPVTAYIGWALARAGKASEAAPSIAYVQKHAQEAKDPYVQALVALALSTGDSSGAPQARRGLLSQATATEERLRWQPKVATHSHAYGDSALVETTALATLALLAAPDSSGDGQKGVAELIARRQAGGGWTTTQSTVLALEALLTAEGQRTGKAEGNVVVTLDGSPFARLSLAAGDGDLVRTIALPPAATHYALGMTLEGEGALSVQLGATRNVDAASLPKPKAPRLVLAVAGLPTEPMRLDSDVEYAVTVTTLEKAVPMPTVVVGIPAGFDVDWARAEAQTQPEKVERLGQRLVFYFKRFEAGAVTRLPLRLTARREGTVSPGLVSAYPYYEPEATEYVEPARLTVK